MNIKTHVSPNTMIFFSIGSPAISVANELQAEAAPNQQLDVRIQIFENNINPLQQAQQKTVIQPSENERGATGEEDDNDDTLTEGSASIEKKRKLTGIYELIGVCIVDLIKKYKFDVVLFNLGGFHNKITESSENQFSIAGPTSVESVEKNIRRVEKKILKVEKLLETESNEVSIAYLRRKEELLRRKEESLRREKELILMHSVSLIAPVISDLKTR